MAVSEFLEDLVSHLPALQLLQQVGYQYLTPTEALDLRGGKRSRVVLDTILIQQLRNLNQITFRGQTHEFTESNLRTAVDALTNIPFDGLVKTNEQAFDLLTLGKAIEQTIDGNKRSYTLQYIDWEHPENNVYHVADEFEVEKTASHELRRPDIVLFVNGIPLAVIECKRPDERDAVEVGVSQHLRNQRQDEIPGLFVYSQLLGSICQNHGKYATAGTPKKFWSTWKEEVRVGLTGIADDLDVKLARLINTPLSTEQLARMFESREPGVASKMKEILAAGERLPSPQDRLLYCLFHPERLLEMTYRYIVFDKNVKKVARYQQYFAIRETLERVTKAKGDQQRPGGVIWHTTGSGKSLTMVMLAKALALEPSIRNPRVVIVTDRIDLDRQIWKTYLACRKSVERAKSGEHLVQLVSQGKADIITTLIDKFESAASTHGLRDESNNVFVLVDESHRSQYGLAHAKMKQVFPNACYIGFTGTPLLKHEKSTAQKFGGFIHTYPMRKAVEDKAVTPILYEGRMSELHGDQKTIDKWFDRITEGLSDQQKADLKKKFRREEELTKTSERLYEIAFDIATHFSENFKGTKFKGQFAVSSKAMALKYQLLFEEISREYPDRAVSARVIISAPDTREDNETIEEEDVPEVQQFWQRMLQEFRSEKRYLEQIIDDFEKKPQPEIIICVDKLLTGFDAPCNTVLYIDKRLRDHNILQAIARVNRLFDGKDFGLVVDYRGIFGALDEAVKKYDALSGFDDEDLEGTFTAIEEEISNRMELGALNDRAGKRARKRAEAQAHVDPRREAIVVALIWKQAPTAQVEIRFLKDDWPEIPQGGDVFDWQEHFVSTDAESLRARLQGLRNRTSEFNISESNTSKEPAAEKPRSTFAGICASELGTWATQDADWLVSSIFTINEPLLIGARSKGCKTLLLTDLAVAVASGTKWMNFFDVPRRRRVLFITGEANYRRVSKHIEKACKVREIKFADLKGFLRVEAMKFPCLPSLEDQEAVRADVQQYGFDLVIVDPLYRGLTGVDAARLNEMGSAIKLFQAACHPACTALSHHVIKSAAREYGEPPTLEDMTGAGIAESCGQWWLIGRNKKYEWDSTHDLCVQFGGREGQGGGLRILFNEQQWTFEIYSMHEYREQVKSEKDQLQEDSRRENLQRKHEQARNQILKAVRNVKVPQSKNAIEQAAGAIQKDFREVFAQMVREQTLVQCPYQDNLGRRQAAGYILKDYVEEYEKTSSLMSVGARSETQQPAATSMGR